METTLANPNLLRNAAEMTIKGISQQKIADRLGVAQTTVSRRLRSPEAQQIIKSIKDKLIGETITLAADNIHHFVKNAQTTTNKDDKYWGCRFSEKLIESIGIMGAPSPTFQMIVSGNTFSVHQSVQNLLQTQGYSQLPVDSIDLPAIEGEIIEDDKG